MAPRKNAKKQPEAPKVNIGAEIFASLRELEKIKGIPVDYMVERLKQALTNAYRKDREDRRDVPADNVGVDLSEKGLSMHLLMTAVEEVEDTAVEIHIEAARKMDPNIQAGGIAALVQRFQHSQQGTASAAHPLHGLSGNGCLRLYQMDAADPHRGFGSGRSIPECVFQGNFDSRILQIGFQRAKIVQISIPFAAIIHTKGMYHDMLRANFRGYLDGVENFPECGSVESIIILPVHRI